MYRMNKSSKGKILSLQVFESFFFEKQLFGVGDV